MSGDGGHDQPHDSEPAVPFLDALGTELVAAAARLQASNQASNQAGAQTGLQNGTVVPIGRRRGWRLPAAAAVAAAVFSVVALSGLFDSIPSQAAAYELHRLENAVEIRVVDVVTDLDAAEQELREAGIDVGFALVPVPDHLVGRSMAAFDGSASVPVELRAGPTGVESILVPAEYEGTLIIEIGRPAAPGEPYRYGLPPAPTCAAIGGQRLDDVRDEVEALSSTVDFVTDGLTGTATRSASAPTDPGLTVVDLVFVSADETLVVLSTDATRAGDTGCESLPDGG